MWSLMMSLLQYNFENDFNQDQKLPINLDLEQDWIPFMGMFHEQVPKFKRGTRNLLSSMHYISNQNYTYGKIKRCNRSKLDLLVFPHFWGEMTTEVDLKVLWSLMVHKNYVKQQIGSILTSGKLIPEYTQLHVRSEFAHYTYKSPTLRKSFIKNIYADAEAEGVKIYEKDNFKHMFLNITDHMDNLKELKQLKQTILNELQGIKQENTQQRYF